MAAITTSSAVGYDFGLAERKEVRAAELYRRSIIFDWV